MSVVVEKTRIHHGATENTEKKLPDDWRWVRLGDVCSIIMGQSPQGVSYNTTGKGEPLLNGPTEFGVEHPTPAQWTTAPTRYAEPGDILFCVRGATTGRKNVADRRYCIGRGLAAIRGSHGLADTGFLMFLLDVVTAAMLRETAGSIFPNLPGDKLDAFPIPLPPLPEQKRIAGLLSEQMAQVSRARQALQDQLHAAAALPAAYLREVFTSPQAQSWPRKRLGDFAETCSGATPSRAKPEYYNGTIPWVKTGELKDGAVEDTEEHVTDIALEECSLSLLPANTLLIAMYGQGQTRGRTATLLRPATTNQACFAVLPHAAAFDTPYLQLWFQHS